MKVISSILLALVVIGYVSAMPNHKGEKNEAKQDNSKAPFYAEFSSERVPGEYVVIFQDYVEDNQVAEHLKALEDQMTLSDSPEDNEVLAHYHIETFRGYGAKLTDEVRESVRSMDHVKYVEASQYYHSSQCYIQYNAVWGLVRTTQRNLPLGPNYVYDTNAGSGVNIYIVDTGIDTTHPDFGGRAIFGADFVDNPSPRTDLNGHGTHVAGTAISNTYGIAKSAIAISVRVLNQFGRGTTVQIINGINWVAAHGRGRKSVANVSIQGPLSHSENAAVNTAVNLGTSFAICAGNYAVDACTISPGSAANGVNVGASDVYDNFASFSNFGRCVDIIGPGVNILSLGLHHGYKYDSGTSMAAPHVAGIMARILSLNPGILPPLQVKNILRLTATTNHIRGNLRGTPNLLIFKSCP